MKTTNVTRLLPVAVLIVACSSDVKNLGNDIGGYNVGSNSHFGNTGGFTATGVETGATSGIGGASAVDAGSSTAYVLNPTLPIDPACTCETNDNICNAARECVPRCDDAGHCARWLAPRFVVDMFVDGDELYYLVAADTDVLRNPAWNGQLYRVNTTTADAPTVVAVKVGSPLKILGKYENVVYVLANTESGYAIYSVTEPTATSNTENSVTKSIATTGPEASMRGHWVAYTSPDQHALMGIDLSGDGQPVVLAQLPAESSNVSYPMVLDDVVVYKAYTNGTYLGMCGVQLSNPAAALECTTNLADSASGTASSGNQYYLLVVGSVLAYAPPGSSLLTLYKDSTYDGFQAGGITHANGWLYVDVWKDANGSRRARLVRVPASVGRYPQLVLPEDIATRFAVSGSLGSMGSGNIVRAVGATHLFFVQVQEPLQNLSQPQYIFSSPLPPQPCDADLPCADTSLVCTSGFCGPA